MKAFKMKFWFRFFAVLDVLFAEKFELETFDKYGCSTGKTKFWKTEIEEHFKSQQ
jgi:hypothetical protein